MQRYAQVILCSVVILVTLFSHATRADQVNVFAASSLRDVISEVAEAFEQDTGHSVVLVFGASSAIARQVSQGAPADVVLLADQMWGDWLVEQGAVQAVEPFAGNRLVLIGRTAGALPFPEIIGEGLIAMAQVDAVPAGRYGKAALVSLGLWERVSPQVIQAANVRAALRFVERGEAEFAIGYASDLKALPDLEMAHEFAPSTQPEIIYSGAYLTNTGSDFFATIQSSTGQSSFEKWGFTPAPEPR